MKISIIIPVYNEKNTISQLIDKVKAVALNKEIIIVNDGSTDGSKEILDKIKDENIKIIHHSQNLGKGAAIHTALKYVTGDIVIIQDADLEYDPNDYHKLIAPILSGEAEIVYGSRILGKAKKSYLRYYLGGRFLTVLTNLLYGTRLTDAHTGYKVFKRDVLKNIKLTCCGFEFCSEVTAKLAKRGYKIKEVPISYIPRTFQQGKKLTWKGGVRSIWTLLRLKFFERKNI